MEAAFSVRLRTVPVVLARALLTTSYRTYLWSISACTMTQFHSRHVQATAGWLHGRSNRTKIYIQQVPELFLE